MPVTLISMYGKSGSELNISCSSSGLSTSSTLMLEYRPATRQRYFHLPLFCHFCEVSLSLSIKDFTLSSSQVSGSRTSISTTYIIFISFKVVKFIFINFDPQAGTLRNFKCAILINNRIDHDIVG